MKRSVVVLSGGQDSVTSLMVAMAESEVVGCIHFQYGQRHSVEVECARTVCERLALELEVVPISSLTHLGNSALIEKGDLGAAHASLSDLPASFVPGRNLIFLTLAAAFAMKKGATQIWTGVCQTDYSGYPDCRQETIDALRDAIVLGMAFKDLEIVTPCMNISKAETFALAARHGALATVLEHSHTCYEGDRSIRHEWGYGCGECPACKIRRAGWEAFLRVGQGSGEA